MTTKRLTIGRLIAGSALVLSLTISAHGQPQFTSITNTEEGAKRIAWLSESNAVYRIEYADQLLDISQGGPAWQTLYDRYPSHGANTFWLDTGNYLVENSIPHPRYAAGRFYRIVSMGNNDGEAPAVTITSPSSGAVLSGAITVSVAAGTSYPVVTTKLYVDGEEMYASDDGTNYTFNTCEWPNGSHVLFATAEAHSNLDGPNGYWPIAVGRAVSSYVPVTFSNLITKIAFSQPFFEPALGQTQQVSATFAANVNWTLQILDEDSNAVRTVTGSGGSMLFNWDGTGDGGASIPDALYTYFISAQTNGQALLADPPPGDDGGGAPPAPGASSSLTESASTEALSPASPRQATASGLNYYYRPLPPMPPIRTNGQWVAWEDVYGPIPPTRVQMSDATCLRLLASLDSPSPAAYSGPFAQAAAAPTRPPTSPAKGKLGDYSICAYSYPNGNTWAVPTWGTWPAVIKVKLEGSSQPMSFSSVPPALNQIGHVCQTMKKLGWKLAYERHDDALSVASMRRADLGIGGGEIFTEATLGLFIAHGTYETDPDYASGASGSKLTVWPSANANDASSPWLRMCQFGFGGNLKWMAILACNSLCDPNFQDMVNHGAIPLKETHLVCGAATYSAVGENIGSYWAENMIKKNQTIVEAWFNAGRQEYTGQTNMTANPTIFRVAGYPECFSDKVKINTAPSSPSPAPGNLDKRDGQVWP
jgi:hypothetical protein